MKKEKTIPFNPNNPKHCEGFAKSIRKIKKIIDKQPKPPQIILTKEEFDLINEVAKNNSFLTK